MKGIPVILRSTVCVFLYLLRVQIIVVICVKSSELIKHVLDLKGNELLNCQKYYPPFN